MKEEASIRTRKVINIFLLALFIVLHDRLVILVGPILTNLFLVVFGLQIFFGLNNLRVLLLRNIFPNSKEIVKKNVETRKKSRLFFFVPRIVWGFFTVLGLLIFGMFLGSYYQSDYSKSTAFEAQNEQKAKLKDVLENYQGLSKLFYLQSQDMDILTNPSIWQDDPQQFTDALTSYHQEKDEILFQWGRLYELRKKAGLPDDPNLKVE